MILSIKFLFSTCLLFVGYYIFFNEYNFLLNSNLLIKNFKTDKKEEIFNLEKIENNPKTLEKNFNQLENNLIDKKLKIKKIIVSKGDTFSKILNLFNFNNKESFEIINKINDVFDLRKLNVNQNINFYLNENDEVKKIEFVDNFDSLILVNLNSTISVKKIELEKVYYEASKEFTISETLYSDGIKNGLPQDILIKLIKLYSFDLDFQRDIKIDTKVAVSYDYYQIIQNEEIKYTDINYALISINNKKLEYFKFETDEGYIDYFNREGKNVKKSILKTPLDGARLSSNFGMRKHPISGYNKMHKGVDFAAPKGTPIYAGGNGIIEYVGNNGGYGKYIRIRHNNEYKTAYAHLSSYKKGITKGSRVVQGDIIGFVGSTGNSTGPHLHYEIIFQGKHINPLKLKLPSGKVLEGKELERFQKEFKTIYANHLNLLYE